MSIRKQFLKTRPFCKVTFRLTKEEIGDARCVHITGAFNDWEKPGLPMKAFKNGSFTVSLDLETGKDHAFRYLVDEQNWMNDPDADKQVPSGFAGSNNFVVTV